MKRNGYKRQRTAHPLSLTSNAVASFSSGGSLNKRGTFNRGTQSQSVVPSRVVPSVKPESEYVEWIKIMNKTSGRVRECLRQKDKVGTATGMLPAPMPPSAARSSVPSPATALNPSRVTTSATTAVPSQLAVEKLRQLLTQAQSEIADLRASKRGIQQAAEAKTKELQLRNDRLEEDAFTLRAEALCMQEEEKHRNKATARGNSQNKDAKLKAQLAFKQRELEEAEKALRRVQQHAARQKEELELLRNAQKKKDATSRENENIAEDNTTMLCPKRVSQPKLQLPAFTSVQVLALPADLTCTATPIARERAPENNNASFSSGAPRGCGPEMPAHDTALAVRLLEDTFGDFLVLMRYDNNTNGSKSKLSYLAVPPSAISYPSISIDTPGAVQKCSLTKHSQSPMLGNASSYSPTSKSVAPKTPFLVSTSCHPAARPDSASSVQSAAPTPHLALGATISTARRRRSFGVFTPHSLLNAVSPFVTGVVGPAGVCGAASAAIAGDSLAPSPFSFHVIPSSLQLVEGHRLSNPVSNGLGLFDSVGSEVDEVTLCNLGERGGPSWENAGKLYRCLLRLLGGIDSIVSLLPVLFDFFVRQRIVNSATFVDDTCSMSNRPLDVGNAIVMRSAVNVLLQVISMSRICRNALLSSSMNLPCNATTEVNHSISSGSRFIFSAGHPLSRQVLESLDHGKIADSVPGCYNKKSAQLIRECSVLLKMAVLSADDQPAASLREPLLNVFTSLACRSLSDAAAQDNNGVNCDRSEMVVHKPLRCMRGLFKDGTMVIMFGKRDDQSFLLSSTHRNLAIELLRLMLQRESGALPSDWLQNPSVREFVPSAGFLLASATGLVTIQLQIVRLCSSLVSQYSVPAILWMLGSEFSCADQSEISRSTTSDLGKENGEIVPLLSADAFVKQNQISRNNCNNDKNSSCPSLCANRQCFREGIVEELIRIIYDSLGHVRDSVRSVPIGGPAAYTAQPALVFPSMAKAQLLREAFLLLLVLWRPGRVQLSPSQRHQVASLFLFLKQSHLASEPLLSDLILQASGAFENLVQCGV